LFILNTDSTPPDGRQLSLSSIRMIESYPRPLRCVAVGGYPPPSIEVHVGSRNVSTDFTFSKAVSFNTGVLGLRQINVQSERYNNEFYVTADDDNTVIKCVASVPGLTPTVELLHLHVDCEYFVHYHFIVLLLFLVGLHNSYVQI